MKKISILGSTGSIGKNTLEVVRHLKGEFQVVALAAHSSVDLMEEQVREFSPSLVALFDDKRAFELQKRLPHCKVVAGMEGLREVASHEDAELVVSALAGSVGLSPTLAAIEAGKTVALANKEVLVAAGELVMKRAKEKKVSIIPIDSEHSAIFQCLHGQNKEEIRRIILTSSGGPFRKYSREELSQATLEEALKHPNWSMGPKVTIDSSTLMNKGLEVIEARWLFDLCLEKIDVVIHPQSIIHSMVEMDDGSILAQLSEPSMIFPIQYALTFPSRMKSLFPPFDFLKNRVLEFDVPDREKFVCLELAFHALKMGKSAACFLNAANEVLVYRFMNREIGWMEIGRRLEALLSRHAPIPLTTIDQVVEMDQQARLEAIQI